MRFSFLDPDSVMGFDAGLRVASEYKEEGDIPGDIPGDIFPAAGDILKVNL